MTLSELDEKHQRELVEEAQDRAERLKMMEEEHDKLINHCKDISPEGQTILMKILYEQHREFEVREDEKLDVVHQLQHMFREDFVRQQEKAERLAEVEKLEKLLKEFADKRGDRGR